MLGQNIMLPFKFSRGKANVYLNAEVDSNQWDGPHFAFKKMKNWDKLWIDDVFACSMQFQNLMG